MNCPKCGGPTTNLPGASCANCGEPWPESVMSAHATEAPRHERQFTLRAEFMAVLLVVIVSWMYTDAHRLKVGQLLAHDGTGIFILAMSEEKLRDYIQGDEAKHQKMLKDGSIQEMDGGDWIRFKGFGSGRSGSNVYHVGIYDGTEPLADGWMLKDWLKKK